MSQNREWTVAAFSGCAARPVVKQAWRVVRARRRASVHPVRARAPRFVCGGDDYLFILFYGSCKVCATISPAAALAAAGRRGDLRAAARHALHVLLTRALCPWR